MQQCSWHDVSRTPFLSRQEMTDINIEAGPSADQDHRGQGYFEHGFIRHLVCLTSCLGMMVMMSIRVNINITIEPMIQEYHDELINGTKTSPTSSGLVSRWIIFGFFYFGMTISHFVFGLLGNRDKCQRIVGLSICLSSAFQVLTPLFMYLGNFRLMIIVIFINGLCAGPILPAFQIILSRWTPVSECKTVMNVAFSGTHVGIVYTMVLSGIISQNFDWRITYYVYGTLGLLWFIPWYLLLLKVPESNIFIRTTELVYIITERGDQQSITYAVPCHRAYSSTAIWALIITRFTYSWGFYMFLTQLPVFYIRTLAYDLQTTGFLCAVPYVIWMVVMHVCNRISKLLIEKEILRRITVRKTTNAIGFLSQSALVFASTAVENRILIPLLLTLSISMGGISLSSFVTNHLEITPKHSAGITGLTITLANCSGFISALVSATTLVNLNLASWNFVFQICAGLYLSGFIVFFLFGSTEAQPWSDNDIDEMNQH